MTPQETELLNEFLSQLTQVRGMAKDPAVVAVVFWDARQRRRRVSSVAPSYFKGSASLWAIAPIHRNQARKEAPRPPQTAY